jgi:vacuolar protein 8
VSLPSTETAEDIRRQLERLTLYAESSDAELQREAAEMLANLAVRPERQEQIVAHGGLRLLMLLTASGNADVQRLAAHAIANLSALPANQGAIARAAGSLEMLLRLVASPIHEVQRQAAKTLANISVIAENMRLIRERGGLLPLVALLGVPQLKTRTEAIAAIANLAVDDENEAALVAAGALGPITKGLPRAAFRAAASAPDDEDLLVQSARALRNLTGTPKHAAALAALGGEALLRNLVASGSDRIKAQAEIALDNLKKFLA